MSKPLGKGKEENSQESDSNDHDVKISEKEIAPKEKLINESRKRISLLSYEESLHKLDILLEQLKNDSLPVQELQRSFLEGTLYIEHCEQLLNKVEQEIIEINEE